MEIVRTKRYLASASELMPDDVREKMELAIAEDPKAGDVVPGLSSVRKLRWALPGRGKRGGVRTTYFHHDSAGTIYLLYVYAKNQQADLTPGDKKVLRDFVKMIKEEYRKKA